MRYYWMVVRGAIVAGVVVVEELIATVRQFVTGHRVRFVELAVSRGVARPDIAAALFGPFGDREPGAAVQFATEVRREAAADDWTTRDPQVFRVRLQAANTLHAAVDLGLIPPTYLLGLIRPDADA